MQYNPKRNQCTPYGLTCEIWEPIVMPCFDRHNEVEINFFPNSTARYLISNKIVEVPKGKLTIFWGLIPHKTIEFSSDAPYYVCTIPLPTFLSWRISPRMQEDLFKGNVLTDSSECMPTIDEIMMQIWISNLENGREQFEEVVTAEIMSRMKRFAIQYQCIGNAQQLSRVANRGSVHSEHVDLVSSIALYIAKHHTEPLKLSDIGRALKIHPDYANSLFRKAFGRTLHNYMLEERVSNAERQLITTDKPIADIALSCGFSTVARFNSAFLKINGKTPSEFRNDYAEYH